MERIQYVGSKERKADSVAGTGLVWERGQVHDVDDVAAGKLLKHPDVWRRFDEAALPITLAAAVAAGGGLADESATLVLPANAVSGPYFLTADQVLVDLLGNPVQLQPQHPATETVTYSDGTQVTGTAPLPAQSPAQQEASAGRTDAPPEGQRPPPTLVPEKAGPTTAAERLQAAGVEAAEQILTDMADDDVRAVGESVGLQLDARNKGQALRVKVLDALFPKE